MGLGWERFNFNDGEIIESGFTDLMELGLRLGLWD